jgi:hypothetical protein
MCAVRGQTMNRPPSCVFMEYNIFRCCQSHRLIMNTALGRMLEEFQILSGHFSGRTEEMNKNIIIQNTKHISKLISLLYQIRVLVYPSFCQMVTEGSFLTIINRDKTIHFHLVYSLRILSLSHISSLRGREKSIFTCALRTEDFKIVITSFLYFIKCNCTKFPWTVIHISEICLLPLAILNWITRWRPIRRIRMCLSQ